MSSIAGFLQSEAVSMVFLGMGLFLFARCWQIFVLSQPAVREEQTVTGISARRVEPSVLSQPS